MSKLAIAAMVAAAIGVSACTSTATVRSAPAVMSFAANQDAIPGRWGVLIVADEIPTQFSSGEYTCSGWTYAVDSTDSFRESVMATMDVAFQEAVLLSSMPSPQAMAGQELAGVVTVTVSSYSAFLSWLSGFWSQTARGEATIRIGIDVRDATGTRIAGFSQGAQRSAQAESGGCDGGSSAIARALSQTTQQLMEGSLERLQDNDRLRNRQGV
jgi:hypothetical protein